MKFAEGDVVSRKTGGPFMTVEDVRDASFPGDVALIHTIWFDADNHVQRDVFAANTLIKWQEVKEQE